MSFVINRRLVLGGMAATGLTVGLSACEKIETLATDHFLHGVASGDPRADSVLIWTRVESDEAEAMLSWQIARDAEFSDLIDEGQTSTNATRDYTVKVVIADLEAGATYFYRFMYKGATSPIGRTRTLPVGRLDYLGLAIASCSNYAFGYFNAYRMMAEDEQVQFVLHLGDYIYEYGDDGWGADIAATLGRDAIPSHEIVSLEDYRLRHGQYKSDLDSQAMHAAHPLIPIWDDHESTNNPWMGGAQNHQPDTEGEWAPRRAASLQVYYEWMPIRDPEPGEDPAAFWRNFRFGDLANLTTLETRHTGRSVQVDYADHLANLETAEDAERFTREVLGAPEREMLSEDMKAHVSASLAEAVADDIPWRLIANQIPMARCPVPDITTLGIVDENGNNPVAEARGYMVRQGELSLPIYLDTWDGYPAARQRFFEMARAAGVQDLFVLTGDSHSFWTNQLFDDAGQPMGLELGTAGISSPGDFEEFSPEVAERLDRMMEEASNEVVWTDNLHRGYVRVELRPTYAQAHVCVVSTVREKAFTRDVLRSVRIEKQDGHLVYTGS